MAKSPTGIPFEEMDHRIRALILVGFCLQSWALMEMELDSAISKALGLSGLQQYVFGLNLLFHSKIFVMKALLHMSQLTAGDKEQFDHTLNSMMSYTAMRNTIAHDGFYASEKQMASGSL